MAAVREAWTDERLDDLNGRVDEISQRMDAGFKEVREEFRAVRGEMREEFGAVRSEMREEFGGVRSEMAAMQRTFIQAGIGALATMMAGFAGTIATILLST